MKSKIICTLVLAILFSANLFAQYPNTKVHTNISEDNGYLKKEYTVFNVSYTNPLMKKIYLYNKDGKRIEEVISMWNGKKGWADIKIYSYAYNEDKLASIVYKGRNTLKDEWPSWSEHVIYTYDNNGSLLSVKKVKSEDIINMLSQK